MKSPKPKTHKNKGKRVGEEQQVEKGKGQKEVQKGSKKMKRKRDWSKKK